MSKKATRRAARQAFPKAKTPPPAKGSYRTRPRSAGASRSTSRPTTKPPSVKRALIWGILMAVVYFLLIEYGWKSGATRLGNLIIAVVALVLFAAVVYAVDWYKYRRFQNKQKGPLK